MSSYDDQKNRSIAISVGINATAAMAANQKDPVSFFKENVDTVVGIVFDTHETFATLDIAAAFPGTTDVSPPKPFVPPTAAPAAAPVQATAPAPIPGAADGDPTTAANWQEFFTDFQSTRFEKWYDNRTSKKSPAGPDFKNKKDDKKALWISNKYGKNPSWVPAALQQVGLA